MTTETSQPACQWKGGARCQFADMQLPIESFQGRNYCRAHIPLGGQNYFPPTEMQALLDMRLARGHADFSGAQFRGGSGVAYKMQGATRAPIILRECVFEEDVTLQLYQDSVLSRSVFLGACTLALAGARHDLSDIRFAGRLYARVDSGRPAASFRGSHFSRGLDFYDAKQTSELVFDYATFLRPPVLHGAPVPQQTTFTGARFMRSAIAARDEGAYRALRNQFHENRARDWEGYFYVREKRCHRRSLPLRDLRFWIPRAVSWLYDKSAAYGYSFERALLAFVGVQIAFGFIYAAIAGRFQLSGRFDAQVAAFTLAQVVKPFELFSVRQSPAWPYVGLVPDNSALWAGITALHSVCSFVLIALFVLAVRWRFRRE